LSFLCVIGYVGSTTGFQECLCCNNKNEDGEDGVGPCANGSRARPEKYFAIVRGIFMLLGFLLFSEGPDSASNVTISVVAGDFSWR